MKQTANAFSWPDAARWKAFAWLLAAFYLFFFPIYFGGAWYGAWSGRAVSPAFAFEAAIPLLPWTIVVYQSVFQIFVLPLLHLPPIEMARMSRQITLALLIAGLCFLAIPTRIAYARATVKGAFAPAFDALRAVDEVYNCAPSLHVALAAIVLVGCMDCAPRWAARIYALWLAALCVSTLTTHQHHLLDVASGFALALIVRRIVRLTPTSGA